MPEWAKLAGIVVILAGLAFKLRTSIVVVSAALVTGVLAGLPLFSQAGQEGIVEMLGRAFSDNRLMTLFLITLPAIGLAERFGLQEQSARLIRNFQTATVGRLQFLYQMFRVLHGILGIRLNGHPVFVRPLIYPMSLGAAEGRGTAGPADAERIKAATSAAENYGNFYGQNLSPVQPGVLLVYGVLAGLGYDVSVWMLVLYAIPIALLSMLFGAIQFWLLDRRLARDRTGFRVQS
jgi:uncharacterized membrane protein